MGCKPDFRNKGIVSVFDACSVLRTYFSRIFVCLYAIVHVCVVVCVCGRPVVCLHLLALLVSVQTNNGGGEELRLQSQEDQVRSSVQLQLHVNSSSR